MDNNRSRDCDNLTIRLGGRLMDFGRPRVMGILNATPDSFYATSRVTACDVAARAGQMVADGADILDIGACSTRPGAAEVSAAEEYERLKPVLEAIRATLPAETVISVDTYRAEVARKVVENYAVDIINDVSGGSLDPEMADTMAALGVPYVLMHMRGTPDTMQGMTDYEDVTADVLRDLAFKADALRQAGVHDLIIDPGFGFAKTVEQNYRLLGDLDLFHEIGGPVLAGMSRKSMLWRPLGITADAAGDATVAIHTMALMKGVDIIRAHDVRAAAQSVALFEMLRRNSNPQHSDIMTFSRQTDRQ